MAELGLNDHHVLQAVNFMRFCRYKRAQRLKAVDHCFQDLKESRLYEDTYTLDEVSEMLAGLLSTVRGEVETELLNSTHTSVLLLRQLLTQAEKWHLKLSADISELENRELLEQIADFEEREISLTSTTHLDLLKQNLQPLNETGGIALLQKEIQRLQTDNEKLTERSKTVENNVTSCLKENEALRKQVKELGAKPVAGADQSEVRKLEGQLKGLRTELDSTVEQKGKESDKMYSDFTTTKHELLKVQEQLELTERELDKKFRETGAYKNLRDMLSKKNEQIKDLRKRLGKYEEMD
ncbi:leucine zipper transcription factor-like protein 1 isoform X2 [Clavelina lepadiformis]|uniref:leucine zipper transcription factor-like protein 1 isoform X2 n=1 Tax=Clavelina lepadiformis TaxID=159417 RepID=UPI0040430616